MIELKQITKEYGRTVLQDLSYKFEKNKIYVIKGVSGCGKSTLLNIIGGLETEYQGQYFFDGQEVSSLKGRQKEQFRQSFGYVFQNSLLLSNLTVMENLLFIHRDEHMIRQYSQILHVSDLLERYPDELSGGQRQRIAIIRALIRNPMVLLADEPTASLDYSNSREIAKLFESLRSENRVILISTHEDCFDGIADEIISLDYGKVGSVTHNRKGASHCETTVQEEQNTGNSLKMLWPFVLRRHRKNYRLPALLPVIFVIFTILFCFSIQSNFVGEYIRFWQGYYPMEVFSVSSQELKGMEEQYEQLEIYSLYIIEGDGFCCYPLLPEEDSGLACEGMLSCGSFPSEGQEVLISSNYATDVMKIKDQQDCVEQEVILDDTAYTISGVIVNVDEESTADADLYYSNIYYPSASACSIFIPYATIEKNGDYVDSEWHMVKLDHLYEDAGTYGSLRDELGGVISVWDGKLVDMESTIEAVSRIILVAFLLAALIASMFIRNEIEMDLFYRRRELGYLQIFGIHKKTIRYEVVLEKMLKSLLALCSAIFIFLVLAAIVFFVTGVRGFISMPSLLLIAIIVLLFNFVNVEMPVRKFLKKSVLSLITA